MTDRRFMVLAAVVLVASRIPFFWHNPDWSFTVWEHCFTLSFPAVYAERMAQEPGSNIPYWLVNQEQMWWHYHTGIGVLAYMVGFLSKVLDTRSLVLVKTVGTAYTLVFVLALVWALGQTSPNRRSWVYRAVPVFLCAFPPVYFLMASLLPLGHYYETHLFHGLFLPFFVFAARGRMSLPAALLAGVLGGLAAVYTFSNLVFPAVLAFATLVFGGGPWLRRVGVPAALGAAALAVYGVIGQSSGILSRIARATPLSGDELVEPGPTMAFTEWVGSGLAWRAAVEHVDFLLGFHGSGIFDLRSSTTGAIMALLLVIATAASAALLSWHSLRSVAPAARKKMTPTDRFLATQGMVVAAFVLAYLVFDPYMMPDDVLNYVGYLLPTFPPLFIGAGAACALVWRSRRVPIRAGAGVAMAVLAGVLVAGWAQALQTNSRPLLRPEFNSCDSLHTQGYYWEPPYWTGPWSAYQVLRDRQGGILNREAGERRCRLALPDHGDRCAFVGYTLEASETSFELDCAAEPPAMQALCARAYGARRWGWDTCWAPTAPPDDLCVGFDGELREACVSGAYQGSSLDWAVNHCLESYLMLCKQTFTDPIAFSACAEQAGRLVEGMPQLPRAQGPPPADCSGWPSPWLGLCERALDSAVRSVSSPGIQSCEALYFERYATELPQRGRLAYDQCLTLARGHYAWCAIGVAREMDGVDCAWTGEFGPHDQFH